MIMSEPKILQNFSLQKGIFCFVVNLRNILEMHSIKLSEEELAFILGYWGFSYGAIKHELIAGRNADLFVLFDRFKTIFPMQYCSLELASHEECLVFLLEKNSSGEPLLVWFDTYYLDYSPNFLKFHYHTIIVVLGSDKNEITFFDNGLRVLNQNTFLKGMLKPFNVYFFDKGKQINFSKTDLVHSGHRQIVDNFLSPTSNLGLSGMRFFLKSFRHFVAPEKFYEIYFQLNRPGGLAISRTTLEKCLSSSTIVEILGAEENLVKRLEIQSNKWRLIANLCFKLSYGYDQNLHCRVQDRIAEIVELEEQTAIDIKNLEKNLNS